MQTLSFPEPKLLLYLCRNMCLVTQSCLTLCNPMDCIVHEVTKSWTLLSDFHFQGAQEVTEIESRWEVIEDDAE